MRDSPHLYWELTSALSALEHAPRPKTIRGAPNIKGAP